jgi:hypothetical protein
MSTEILVVGLSSQPHSIFILDPAAVWSWDLLKKEAEFGENAKY